MDIYCAMDNHWFATIRGLVNHVIHNPRCPQSPRYKPRPGRLPKTRARPRNPPGTPWPTPQDPSPSTESPRDAVTAALKQAAWYHEDSPKTYKEMKVKLPLEHHIKLHGLKILNNQSISCSVERALEAMFRRYGID